MLGSREMSNTTAELTPENITFLGSVSAKSQHGFDRGFPTCKLEG